MKKLDIRQIEITSPIESLKIGDDYFYSGEYKDGYEEGISKIKSFYQDVLFYNGVEKNTDGGNSVWMDLENNKMVLLGFLKYNKFTPLNKFKNN